MLHEDNYDTLAAAIVGPVSVRQVRLNQGGYDRSGRYFGVGATLYVIDPPDGRVCYLRSWDREDAVAQARRMYPNAKVRA